MQDKIQILKISKSTWLRMRKDKQTPSPAILIRGRRYYRAEVIEEWPQPLE